MIIPDRHFNWHDDNVCMTYGGIKINFSAWLPDDKKYLIGDILHIPESRAYKFIFMNNDVSDQNIKFACNHALQKVYRFIENYKA